MCALACFVLKCCTSHYVSWVPLVRNPRSSTFWHPFFERVSERVDCWKASLFSSRCVFFSGQVFQGRISLVQVCFSSFLLYFLSV